MSRSKDIAIIGVYVALLFGAQFALSWVAGVELVTVLIAAFCYFFGFRRGLALVNIFSTARCIIFGFYPNVIVLYLVYFNLFACVFALLGRACGKRVAPSQLAYASIAAAVLTACFTLLDQIITVFMLGMKGRAAQAYFYAALPVMAVGIANALATTLLLFSPLVKALGRIYGRRPAGVCGVRLRSEGTVL